MNQEKVGELIAILRKEKGLTQAQLAEKIGVSDRAVSKWERGICMPEPSKLGIVADILEISVSELLNGERSSNENNQDKKNDHSYNYKNNFILKYFLPIILFIVVVFVFIHVIFYGNEVKRYVIVSNNDNYSCNGNVIMDNKYITIDLFNLILKNDSEKIKGYYFDYSVYLDEFLIIKNGDVYSYEYNRKDELIELEQFLRNLSVHIVDDIYNIEDNDILNSAVELVINYLDDELNIQKYTLTFKISN